MIIKPYEDVKRIKIKTVAVTKKSSFLIFFLSRENVNEKFIIILLLDTQIIRVVLWEK